MNAVDAILLRKPSDNTALIIFFFVLLVLGTVMWVRK